MSAHQGMCPLFQCAAGALEQHLKICFADFQSITAKRQLLRTHYLCNCCLISVYYMFHFSWFRINYSRTIKYSVYNNTYDFYSFSVSAFN